MLLESVVAAEPRSVVNVFNTKLDRLYYAELHACNACS